MEKDFEYQQMLAGELYLAGGILPEHKSVHRTTDQSNTDRR